MISNRVFNTGFLIAVTALLLSASAIAQDNRNRLQIEPITPAGNLSQLYIDQVGLSFLSDVVPGLDYFDKDSYILGPQDVITLDIKGPVPLTARALVVNSSGHLYVPLAGNLHIAGQTLAEATQTIQQALEGELTEFELSINVQKPRPVEVQIIGDVPNAGRYLFPAGSRLDAAFLTALSRESTENRNGGEFRMSGDYSQILSEDERLAQQINRPQTRESQNRQQNIGQRQSRDNQSPRATQADLLNQSEFSLRNIIIERANETVESESDLISYFYAGNKKMNPYLYDGDKIRIKRINETTPRVSVSGAVQNAGEFEYRSGDTVQKLLELANGFLSGADESSATLYRLQENREMSTQSIDLRDLENSGSISLEPNDRLVVSYAEDATRSASAWVYGEARIPGNFPIQNDETTVEDLLKLAGGLTANALPHGSYLIRPNLTDRDVESATTLRTSQLMRTSNQLQQGFDYLEMEQELASDQRMFIDLSSEVDLDQIRITDGDQLYIPRDYQNVVLYGQFNNPGRYPYNPSLTVQDYIQRGGGLSIIANPDRIYIIKAGSRAWKSPGETTLQSGDIIYVDRIPFDELNAQRNYEIQVRNLRRSNTQLILTAVSTVTAVITTYVAITR